MATASRENPRPEPRSGGGLSLQTLAIASAGSVAAAVFTHMIWTGGAIVGAAITPIIVALVSEALKKPAQVITAVTPVTKPRRSYGGDEQTDVPRTGAGAPMAPPPEVAEEPYAPTARRRREEDRFGIWEADQRSFWDRIKGRPLKIAMATGALAFAIGALALTATELVFGGSVGGGGDRTTIIPGKQRSSDTDKKTTTETTETTQTTETAPAETTETTPEEEQTETVPTTPQTTPQTVPTTPVTPAPQSETVPTTPQETPPPGTATTPGGTAAPPAG